ncbi:amidase [Exophiala aquamarina CBS 119918]|uniref:Amidase n=1 Tax=Exophiala aquamarina CBS 119918 TaxID=1182545 RepID=A0A072P5C4_9EURO|nr:amidase [Exophiala aquamarina CBS 119918]KEF54493.1 amidase [Exophiala aquamarina CBS 119918]
MGKDWKSLVAQKRAQVDEQLPQEWRLPAEILNTVSASANINVLNIPRECGILTAKEIDITEKHDAVALVEQMANKRLTASEVTLAFCKRAAIAHQVTNCLTEMFFGQAQERARFLDEYLEREGRPMGPLHGLPISLKDSFNLKGISATIGYVSFIEHPPADFNSPLVEVLLKAGAVLYVKTNLPQTLMTADSENNVFGRTLNPYKLSLTAGGSSGGEGALVRMRGSLIGVGTDIGGSIRIPALCCGTFGFKPTTDRIPMGGQVNPVRDGWTGIIPVAGPLAHSPRDLRLFLETVIKSKPWDFDYSAVAIPWHPVPEQKSLRIGVILECPSWPVAPPILRAMETATKKLERAGHKVIKTESFPSFKDATDLAWSFFDIDNSGTGVKFIQDSGEPVVKSVADMYTPPPEGRKTRTLDNFMDLTAERSKFQAAWHKIFVDNQLDVLVAPGSQKTAVPHDTFRLPPYTANWNLLAYPGCIIPYLKADKSIDVPRAEYREDYDAEAVDGAPCNIQVIARPEHDEALIAAVEVIAKDLGVSM